MKRRKRPASRPARHPAKRPPSQRSRQPFFRVAHLGNHFGGPLEIAAHLRERTWENGNVELHEISFFLLLADNTVCLLTPERAKKDEIDNAIRSLVITGVPCGRITKKVTAVVAVAEAWSNPDLELADTTRTLKGLPGTFEQALVILDSATSQRLWTARIEGEKPNRRPVEWEETTDYRSFRFGNFFPQGRN